MKRYIFTSIFIGLVTFFAGSIISLPLMSLVIDTNSLFNSDSQSGILVILCIYSALFNILPYVVANIVYETYELSIKGMSVIELLGMSVSIFLGGYYLDIFAGFTDIKNLYEISKATISILTYVFAYFFPYYFTFVSINLIRWHNKNKTDY